APGPRRSAARPDRTRAPRGRFPRPRARPRKAQGLRLKFEVPSIGWQKSPGGIFSRRQCEWKAKGTPSPHGRHTPEEAPRCLYWRSQHSSRDPGLPGPPRQPGWGILARPPGLLSPPPRRCRGPARTGHACSVPDPACAHLRAPLPAPAP
ncbi:hypothetical protein H1C71_000096, partial [Ictidomys tridecemlineatus]